MEGGNGQGRRIASIDALRGFDMFFITGGAALIGGICAALGCGDGWLAAQMHHAKWVGFRHHDTIFPLFLFLAGVSWPFSLAAQRARGRTTGQIVRKALLRGLVLFLIGLSFGGILKFKPEFRLMSVLGYIGLSWTFAALIHMSVQTWWKRLAVAAALLAGHYCLTHFGVAPDAPAGAKPYDMEWTLVFYFDRMLWINHMLWKGFEPESLFSLASGVALALVGMSAGTALACDRWTAKGKTGVLALGAGVCGLLTAVTVLLLGDPVIKQIWTASFVFAACAYSFAMLALFHWIVDVKGWTAWTGVFTPVGRNSILVYTLMMIGVTGAASGFLFGGLSGQVGAWKAAVNGLGFYLTTWFIAWYCARKNVFIKA